jgi:hypothetical protein
VRKPSEHNAAIRPAYIHNLSGVGCQSHGCSGLAADVTGYSFFDPLIGGGVAIM